MDRPVFAYDSNLSPIEPEPKRFAKSEAHSGTLSDMLRRSRPFENRGNLPSSSSDERIGENPYLSQMNHQESSVSWFWYSQSSSSSDENRQEFKLSCAQSSSSDEARKEHFQPSYTSTPQDTEYQNQSFTSEDPVFKFRPITPLLPTPAPSDPEADVVMRTPPRPATSGLSPPPALQHPPQVPQNAAGPSKMRGRKTFSFSSSTPRMNPYRPMATIKAAYFKQPSDVFWEIRFGLILKNIEFKRYNTSRHAIFYKCLQCAAAVKQDILGQDGIVATAKRFHDSVYFHYDNIHNSRCPRERVFASKPNCLFITDTTSVYFDRDLVGYLI